MAVIANKDDDLKYKKQQIELFFSVHTDVKEREEYLQSAYQDRYTEILTDGVRVGYKPQDNGLLMWEGAYLSHSKESVFSWNLVAEWTAQLIDKKGYYVNTDIKGLKTQNGQQLSLFDMANFDTPVSPGGSEEMTFFPHPQLSQQIIDEALCIGANDRNSRLIICAYFMKDKDDNAQFLQEHYGENGAGFYFNDRKVSIWYSTEGIRIAEGESANRSSATVVSWEQAAKRIRELLDLGRYMPQSELDKVSGYEVNQLADRLLLMYRDIEDDSEQYLPTLQAIYEAPGGFPEMDKALAALLKEPESLQTIVLEYAPFAEAYKANPGIMRLRYHRPLELGEKLTDLQREPVIFTAAQDYNPQRRFFISTDEIDEILRGGKNSTDYRLAVYSFYRNHTDRKEREDFLKNYHGEYSGSSGGNDDLLYQKGKGISFSHGTIGEPYAKVELKWNQVEKRVSTLISSGKFLSEDDRAAMPQYEKQQLAREIQTFFNGVPQERPRPFPYGFDYWDAVKLIEPQLDEPQKVEEIHQMMLPVWEATPQDDRNYQWRKTAFENLIAYRNGIYTLFRETKTPMPIEAPAQSEQLSAPEEIPEQTQRQQVTDRLEDLGYVVSDETLDVGLSEYASHGGKGNYEDIADYIEDEILSDEGESDFSDITEELPAKEEQTVLAPPKRERVVFSTLHPEIPPEQRYNFRISDKELGYGTPGEKFAANAAAIRCLKQIEYENRLATPDEQITLSRYVGWGGLADCFDDRNSHYQELKSLLDTEEYAAARESTLTAFYTSPVITNAIYQVLSQIGFQTGNLLEPACGVGNFIGSIPENMNCKAYGVELDSISGRIAQQLYQNSSISVNGFEKVQMPDSFFDVAIGNVPFGDFKVLDRKYDKHHWLIHDYFFGKALDKVRPGGIVAFITSKGTMDKDNSAVRKYLAQRADLVGAIRLPDNAFKRNAGTEVTSDIIFLQKRDRIIDIEPDWVHLDNDENGIKMNSYFVQHPEMVLGKIKMESTRFGMDSTCKAYENSDLSELLSEAVNNLHAQITEYEVDELEDTEEDLSIPADPAVRNFSYTVSDGKLYFRENSRMHPVNASVTAENRIRGMIVLRDCVRTLIEYQTENYPDEIIEREQQKLNALYDSFVKKYDRIFTRGNNLAFCEDSSYCLLCSLEVQDDEGNFKQKADMFSKRTIRPHVPVTSVDTASEALAVSISEKAQVDMEYMSALSGKTAEELEAELSGVIFRDIVCAENAEDIPTAFVDISRFPLVTADEYLSGKVRHKLRMAKALSEKLPPAKKEQIAQNISALEAVQPVDLTAGEIGVRIGATWIPPEIYRRFMFELFDTGYSAKRRMNILYSKYNGEWNITEKTSDYGNIKAVTTYGTKRMSAYQILEQTLNLKDVRVFDYVEDEHGNKKAVLNKKETAIAQDRQELIKAKFSEWIWKDIDRRETLCKIYNETFNAVRPREYDGSHITFSGINPEITLRTHQINAIAHIMYGGNTLLAHEVGAGKTFEIVAAAMEMKRLGLCSKSLIVVPNHITEQWAAEWLQLYPSANILVATKKDFERKNRRKFCGRIATGDYDAIIIGHSQFEKIPMSAERQRVILQQQIDEILFGIQDAKSAKAERYTVKQMEKTKKSLEQRLAKLNDQSRKDDLVTFEELGCDRIFIDESHYFKNLFLATKMRNVGGIAQTEAQKSSDLFMKTQYLDELTGGRGTIFATGTPISNSMVEMYTIQRYLQYRNLQETGMQHFDAWAANFGETITAIELSPEGSGYRAKTRFAKFYNLPELMAMFKETADIQTADMLKLPVPKANFHTEVISPSELQQEMIKGLAERAEEIRNGSVDPSVDNMLKITNDGRKLALDMRLVNPLAMDDENGKTAVCARNVFATWERTSQQRGAQLVFCDLSTPKGDGAFNVYDDLRKKLMEKGIPEEEIAFIHDANTEAKKKELFGKVRSGQVRVLIGSTQKMGAGTNVQDRLVALHDLDCPWRPSDLAQRLGRIIRQGNLNPEVDIYRYVTENTFDAYLYQLVENKQKFIAQIMTSKTPLRAAEDVDETALSYSEIKALATGNPLIIEKCNLEMEVGKLNMLKANHLNQKYALEDLVLRKYPATITRLTERIAGYEKDVQLVAEHPKPKDGFAGMVILDTPYADKEAAGKAIIDVCTKMTVSDAVALGQYRGFSLALSYDGASNEYRMTMKGTLSHTVVLGADVFGNIARMDNALGAFPDKLKAVREDLESNKVQLENARIEMDTPFAKEEELQQKTARLKELNILLNMDQKDHELLDGEPDEGDENSKVKSITEQER
ncbi:MAG: SNF2-related protein [Oscillospiraceae bacterium]